MKMLAALALCAALVTPAVAWGEKPVDDSSPQSKVAQAIAAQRFVSMNCDGVDSNRWALDRYAASFGYGQAAQGSLEIHRPTQAWSMFLVKNKADACTWIWNAFGPNGTRAPGILFANPSLRKARISDLE